MREPIAAAGTTEDEIVGGFKKARRERRTAEGLAMLVLDANILIRAVLGSRVLGLLRKYGGQVEFIAPDVAFHEAREHLPRGRSRNLLFL